ncbi:putative golgin subfamily A member 6-like protein 6-like, partial [Triplophysa rosa]
SSCILNSESKMCLWSSGRIFFIRLLSASNLISPSYICLISSISRLCLSSITLFSHSLSSFSLLIFLSSSVLFCTSSSNSLISSFFFSSSLSSLICLSSAPVRSLSCLISPSCSSITPSIFLRKFCTSFSIL